MKHSRAQFRLRSLTILVAIVATTMAPIAALAKMSEARRGRWIDAALIAGSSLAPFLLIVGPWLSLLFFDRRRRPPRPPAIGDRQALNEIARSTESSTEKTGGEPEF